MAVSLDFMKMVQLINFFAQNARGKTMGKIELLKAVFFADRYHLLKYGRLVSGDTYYAMKHGPVASRIKNICNLDSEQLSQDEFAYTQKYLSIGKNTVHAQEKYEKEFFSESDIEALEKALNLYRQLKNNKIDVAEYSHRFFDWERKYKPFLPERENKRTDLDIEDFFQLCGSDDYCAEIPADTIALNRQLIDLF